MRVCDWIANYLYDNGIKNVHGLMGGGSSGLNDGFIKHGKINYVCYHHEQGAGHGAIGESKFTGKVAVVNPTTGCAGTNCATSVLNAWQDGVPVVFISGNVKLDACSAWINRTKHINIRKFGVQEHNIVDTYKSMTKMSRFVTSVYDVAKTIQEALYVAAEGRPGPVWIDIPADIQTAMMPTGYLDYEPPKQPKIIFNPLGITRPIECAQRPVVLAGYGIRQSNTVEQFKQFVTKYELPFVSTYGARDYMPNDHPLSIGAVGIKGSRAGNFAMQNADLLIILGSSLGTSVTGYDPDQFSPKSHKILIDVDKDELNKNVVDIGIKVQIPLKDFFKAML
jgi:acetolactate synthase I/II/III large subunit